MRPLIVLLVLATADNNYGYTNQAIDDAAFETVVYDGLHYPYPTAELKALSPAARAMAVQQLGKVARAYYDSAAFKQRYRELAQQSRAPAPVPPQPYDKFVAQKKKELEVQKSQALQSLTNIPDAAQRKQLKDVIEQGYAQQEKMFSDKSMVDTIEQQRFTAEKAKYDESLKRYPDDPNVRLKAVLTQFLADTADVDCTAKTVKSDDGKLHFVNKAYEQKSDMWKKTYRVGKPGADAARAFAKEWLAAL